MQTLPTRSIIATFEKYNLLQYFFNEGELSIWIKSLNEREINNLLNLNIDPNKIEFSPSLLLNRNLLTKEDYNARVEAIASISNAEGYHHLFNALVEKEFLDSPKFFQDIETLKRAKCAQTPLWIIGKSAFINSPFHDEDFEMLVTARDTSEKRFDYVLWDALATTAKNQDSITSGYHRIDMQTILKSPSEILQMSNLHPKSSLNNLAIDKVSLTDPYHLENMSILAEHHKIGNFLFALMSDEMVVKVNWYRKIIDEMINHEENQRYAFLLCLFALGEEKAKYALRLNQLNFYEEIESQYNIDELFELIKLKLNIVPIDPPPAFGGLIKEKITKLLNLKS